MASRQHFLWITVFLLLILSLTFTTGCIQTQAEPEKDADSDIIPLEEILSDRGNIYVQNISEYVISSSTQWDQNLSDAEIAAIAQDLEKKYKNTYDAASGWYGINWNEFHISIGRAFGQTDYQIRKYLDSLNRASVISYEGGRDYSL